jgi:integrase
MPGDVATSDPSVAVWTARQLAGFFDFVREDRLCAMWWLIALRGLRRGEAAGLRWIDIDLDQRVVMIEELRIAYGRTVAVGTPPKPEQAGAPSPSTGWPAP